MPTPIRRWTVPALIVSAFACSRAGACLNDTSVSPGEAEFRSRYETPAGKDGAAPSPPFEPGRFNVAGVAGLAIGTGLIAGSSVMLIRRRKNTGGV
jgi:hypothetical protein